MPEEELDLLLGQPEERLGKEFLGRAKPEQTEAVQPGGDRVSPVAGESDRRG